MVESKADWNLYRTFLAVIQAGSFSAAARRLGTTQPTVGRQIETLESSLGTKLFTRSQRGLLATPAARELVHHAETMDAAASALQRASSAGSTDETGTVRLTAGAMFAVEVLPPLLTPFSRRYPNIELEMSVSSRTEDLLQRDADIAVRMTPPQQKALTACKLGKVVYGLYAHRSYIEANGIPKSLTERAQHRLIGFDQDQRILRAFGGLTANLNRGDFAYRTDNVTAQMALMRAGIGIAAHHVNIASRDPELVPILPKQVKFERPVWLVMHADLKKTRRVRLLFDHLKRELTRYLAESH